MADHCYHCGLGLVPGDDHNDPKGCIKALRNAMLKQRQAAESLAFDVSVRFLAVLEQLALNPDVGVPYHAVDTTSGKPVEVHHQHVAGIFAAIGKMYREMGDWTPLADAKEEIGRYSFLLGVCTGLLSEIVNKGSLSLPKDVADRIHETIESATRLAVGQPGPDRS